MGSWGQVEAGLYELARLDQQLAALAVQRAQELERVEAVASLASRPLEQQRRELTLRLERFCRRQGPELVRVNGHGRRLRGGRVGFRTSHAVLVRNEVRALRALAHWRAGQQFLRVRTELDRDALRRFLLAAQALSGRRRQTRQRLRRVGIELQPREQWFYEVEQRAGQRWG